MNALRSTTWITNYKYTFLMM